MLIAMGRRSFAYLEYSLRCGFKAKNRSDSVARCQFAIPGDVAAPLPARPALAEPVCVFLKGVFAPSAHGDLYAIRL